MATENFPYQNSPATVSVFDFATMPLPPLLSDLTGLKVTRELLPTVQAIMNRATGEISNQARERLSQGMWGYFGQTPNGQPVTYGWVTFRLMPLDRTGWAFAPPPGDVWLFDFATLPEFRGHGYYPALLRFILHDLAKNGVGKAWIGTASGNGTSARAIWRAGFKYVAQMRVTSTPGIGLKFEALPVSGGDEQLYQIARDSHIRL